MSSIGTSLHELVHKYFRKKGYKAESSLTMEGTSGLPHEFDLVITKSNEHRAVRILDWKRTVGVNMVINFDKASEDVGLKKPIIVSNKFSSHAKAYANRKGIILLTKREVSKF
jgi:hypothetical protein